MVKVSKLDSPSFLKVVSQLQRSSKWELPKEDLIEKFICRTSLVIVKGYIKPPFIFEEALWHPKAFKDTHFSLMFTEIVWI